MVLMFFVKRFSGFFQIFSGPTLSITTHQVAWSNGFVRSKCALREKILFAQKGRPKYEPLRLSGTRTKFDTFNSQKIIPSPGYLNPV